MNRICGLVLLHWVVGCQPAKESAPTDWEATMRGIATTYRSYGRVDDWNRWAPELCILAPGQGRHSEAGKSTPHGGKLFYLYAKHRKAYLDRAKSPVGQVVVKEAWTPVEAADGERTILGDKDLPYAKKNGKRFKPGELMGLFVMMKADDGSDPKTDEGWVYATMDPSGKTVKQPGKIAACINCHERNKDRLFFVDLEGR
ncbi:MAG: cytochrome P460 family protein [Planctomycetota bacterium]